MSTRGMESLGEKDREKMANFKAEAEIGSASIGNIEVMKDAKEKRAKRELTEKEKEQFVESASSVFAIEKARKDKAGS